MRCVPLTQVSTHQHPPGGGGEGGGGERGGGTLVTGTVGSELESPLFRPTPSPTPRLIASTTVVPTPNQIACFFVRPMELKLS